MRRTDALVFLAVALLLGYGVAMVVAGLQEHDEPLAVRIIAVAAGLGVAALGVRLTVDVTTTIRDRREAEFRAWQELEEKWDRERWAIEEQITRAVEDDVARSREEGER